jgi:hypothetical protein
VARSEKFCLTELMGIRCHREGRDYLLGWFGSRMSLILVASRTPRHNLHYNLKDSEDCILFTGG